MLYKRENGVWYIKLTGPDGKPIRHSARTTDKAAAQEYHDRLKTKVWEVKRVGVKPTRTWDEAALRWLEERANKRSYRDDVQRIRWFTEHFRGKPLGEITRDLVHNTITSHLEGRSDRTKDLYVALLRAIMRRAQREWEWIDTVPAYRTYDASRIRVRFLTPEQVRAVLAALPEHQREVVIFALNTGLRQGNVLGLQWSEVDLDRRQVFLGGGRTKNAEALSVRLNEVAMGVLRRQRGKHGTSVFTYKGAPLRAANTRAWRKALRTAGVEDFRWHDLRHTWASWLRQAKVPTWALQEMAGWKSEAMARRYAHVTADHLADYADAVADRLGDMSDLMGSGAVLPGEDTAA